MYKCRQKLDVTYAYHKIQVDLFSMVNHTEVIQGGDGLLMESIDRHFKALGLVGPVRSHFYRWVANELPSDGRVMNAELDSWADEFQRTYSRLNIESGDGWKSEAKTHAVIGSLVGGAAKEQYRPIGPIAENIINKVQAESKKTPENKKSRKKYKNLVKKDVALYDTFFTNYDPSTSLSAYTGNPGISTAKYIKLYNSLYTKFQAYRSDLQTTLKNYSTELQKSASDDKELEKLWEAYLKVQLTFQEQYLIEKPKIDNELRQMASLAGVPMALGALFSASTAAAAAVAVVTSNFNSLLTYLGVLPAAADKVLVSQCLAVDDAENIAMQLTHSYSVLEACVKEYNAQPTDAAWRATLENIEKIGRAHV